MGWLRIQANDHRCSLPTLNWNPWYVSKQTRGFKYERGTPGDVWQCDRCKREWTIHRKFTHNGAKGELIFK